MDVKDGIVQVKILGFLGGECIIRDVGGIFSFSNISGISGSIYCGRGVAVCGEGL